MSKSELYSIEEVAEQLNVTPRTLHYYEEIGLIHPSARTEGGHRLFDQTVMQTIGHILRLKHHLGASLQEIKTILDAEQALEKLRESYLRETSGEEKQHILSESIELLQGMVARIDEKVEKLAAMREGFESRLERVKRIKEEQ